MVIVVDEPANAAAEGPPPLSDGPSRVRPPTVTGPTEFPFRGFEWRKFERLCQDIANAHGFTNVHRYGRPGQAQDGVDFIGLSNEGVRTAFQVRQKAEFSAGELEAAVEDYATGAVAARTDAFVVCMSVEGNDRNLRDRLDGLNELYPFPIKLWDAVELTHLLHDKEALVRRFFGPHWVEVYFGTSPSRGQRLDSEALLIGPVQALGLSAKIEEARRLTQASPAEAATVYQEVADALRQRFPGHADRFDRLRATCLKDAGNPAASHDALMELAIRDLFDRAEARISSGVAQGIRDLHNAVDEVRQARGAAVRAFEQWHEHPDVLGELAQQFDALGPDDEYAPVTAALLAEAAVADREFRIVLDREAGLRGAGEHGDRRTALRVRIAVADAGAPGAWQELIGAAESLRFSSAEGTYVCLRAARWCAWNGQIERAESLYRLATKLGAECDLDLDVENALWSLMPLYPPKRYEELSETNELALSIQGSRSYVTANPQTRERTYRHLANRELPDAHLWSRHRLLESIRSGCLLDELESHGILARLYGDSDEPLAALEHAVLGGAVDRVKDVAPHVDAWPDFLISMVRSPAPWVLPAVLSAIEQVGDIAPGEVASRLAHELVDQLQEASEDMTTAPAVFQALRAVVLEATDGDLERLMPVLDRAAPREPDGYRLTDPGVGMVAARVYRFRPAFRRRAASILGEMAVRRHTNDWGRALRECGDDLGELITAFESVAEREGIDVAGPLADLEHLNEATQALWSKRLRFVDEHPLGARPRRELFLRYDVPADFLRDQDDSAAHRYVDKLVAIGSNPDEAIVNRSAALGSAANVVDLLSADRKGAIFEVVRALTDSRIPISELDQYHARTLHELSRVRLSFGDATDVRTAALWLLGRVATEPEECSQVVRIAMEWVRSDSEVLQRGGAEVLTLPNLASADVQSADLAPHPNQWVRRAAILLPGMRERPEVATLELLAPDPFQPVRVEVVYALPRIQDIAPEAYERIRALLLADQSAIVRGVTAEVLEPPN